MVGRKIAWSLAVVLLLCLFAGWNYPSYALSFKFWTIYCDCDWDGIYDIKKTVEIEPGERIEDACPKCCKCIGYEPALPELSPLPFILPSPESVSTPVIDPPSTVVPQTRRTIFIPYRDGAILVDVRLRAKGEGDWVMVRSAEIDTGASITLFPRSVANRMGISLRMGKQVTMTDVSGTKLNVFIHEIEIEFVAPDGVALEAITIRAAFAESDSVPVLIGRLDFLDFVQIITEKTGVYLKLR